MKQLLEITSVPIQIEMKTSHARLEQVQGTAEMEISRDNENLSIKSRPIRLNMDTYQPQGGALSPTQQMEEMTYQASAAFSPPGQLTMNTTIGEDAAVKLASAMAIPQSSGEDWDPAELNIRYEMDKLNFDFKQNGFEFTPGDIEITVTQRPELTIKYIGGPLYVPPSADPEYEPVDVKA